MKKSDEMAYICELKAQAGDRPHVAVDADAIADAMGMNRKRAGYLLAKNEHWEYGVSIWHGWFRPEAFQ